MSILYNYSARRREILGFLPRRREDRKEKEFIHRKDAKSAKIKKETLWLSRPLRLKSHPSLALHREDAKFLDFYREDAKIAKKRKLFQQFSIWK